MKVILMATLKFRLGYPWKKRRTLVWQASMWMWRSEESYGNVGIMVCIVHISPLQRFCFSY